MAANPELASQTALLTETIRQYYSCLHKIPGFLERVVQKQMAWAIATTLVEGGEGERVIVIQAPTGVGKSLAYILGATAAATVTGKQIVIATATTALQTQLSEKDIKNFLGATKLHSSVRIAKGRGRYVCAHNVDQLLGHTSEQSAFTFGDDHLGGAVWPFKPTPNDFQAITDLEQQLQSAEWDGDLDHLKEPLDQKLRFLVTTTRSKCLGSNCSHYKDCAFFKARSGLKDANIIITNQDLVLSERAMVDDPDEGRILPSPEDAIWIFDEAHHLPAKALAHFAASLTLETAIKHIQHATKVLDLTQKNVTLNPKIAEAMSGARESLSKISAILIKLRIPVENALMGSVTYSSSANSKTPVTQTHRFVQGVVPKDIYEMAASGIEPTGTALGKLLSVRAYVSKSVNDGSLTQAIGGRLIPALGEAIDRVASWNEVFHSLSEQDPPGLPPTARWIERVANGQGRETIETTLYSSPVSCADDLHRMFWKPMYAAVLTSATLTGLGKFTQFGTACGLNKTTRCLRLGSPFNLQEQAEIIVPMTPDPKDVPAHTAAVTDYIERNTKDDEATLVLFASRRQMQEVYDSLDMLVKKRVLIQGELPRDEILKRHTKNIKKGKHGIIFGLASFAEGIDLPGDLCQHVIIAKIPFTVPDTPIEATLAEWLKANGRDPFIEIALPDVSRRLTQWCGRLIRTETDHGRISVLDSRLRTRTFGRQLLDSLPPFKRTFPK